jgi:hypothetical protein
VKESRPTFEIKLLNFAVQVICRKQRPIITRKSSILMAMSNSLDCIIISVLLSWNFIYKVKFHLLSEACLLSVKSQANCEFSFLNLTQTGFLSFPFICMCKRHTKPVHTQIFDLQKCSTYFLAFHVEQIFTLSIVVSQLKYYSYHLKSLGHFYGFWFL